ncbi:MAG: lipase [Pseudomonadota bacterium]
MPAADASDVSSRAVFFIGGYDPKSPEAFFERFRREAMRYEELIGASIDDGAMEMLHDDIARVSYRTDHVDYAVTTDFHFMSVDSLVLKDFSRPFLSRLCRYLVTFADYTITLTAFKFVRHAWRFSLYFLYPFVALLLSFLASLGIAALIWTSGVSLSWLMAPVVFLAAFSACVQLLLKRWSVLHLMDLWSFSREFLRRQRPAAHDALQRLAFIIAQCDADDRYDEIVVIGHSTGGALILEALDKAVREREELGHGRARVAMLTVGSTALKIGLHPAALWFRQATGRIVENDAIFWAEYQCVNDVINFYRTAPAKLMGVGDGSKPVVGRIRVRNMVDPEFYKEHIRGNFFRLHYQFVFGNTRRYHYDFPGICLGSKPLEVRATQAPKGSP